MNESSLISADHLFISYATEDGILAEWLSLKLATEGYRVWCDRIKLLGGESYPRDIDEAIKTGSFRVLALLSHASIRKPNPVKERTMALNVGKKRGVDFMIPLNVSDLQPTDLDWMTGDLTFIPFGNWADGFAQLLKKLHSIDAPRSLSNGKEAVCQWIDANARPIRKHERLWSNLLPISEIPDVIWQFEVQAKNDVGNYASHWPLYRQNRSAAWSFVPPPDSLGLEYRATDEIKWRDTPLYKNLNLHSIVTSLIKQSINSHCLKKGLKLTPDFKRLYIPKGLLADDKIHYKTYNNTNSYLLATSERNFYRQGGQRPPFLR
jgi:hypothetical protein